VGERGTEQAKIGLFFQTACVSKKPLKRLFEKQKADAKSLATERALILLKLSSAIFVGTCC
jgi:hypothetical protein